MRKITFEGKTWEKYEYIRKKDRVLHNALRKVILDMIRNEPEKGIGKPEKLKHELAGLWSRRISSRDRLIYTFTKESIHIIAIGGHYENIF